MGDGDGSPFVLRIEQRYGGDQQHDSDKKNAQPEVQLRKSPDLHFAIDGQGGDEGHENQVEYAVVGPMLDDFESISASHCDQDPGEIGDGGQKGGSAEKNGHFEPLAGKRTGSDSGFRLQ